MRKLFNRLCAWISGVWTALVEGLKEISRSTLYHFIAGLIVGAFACITLGIGAWCFVPVFVVGFIKEFIKLWRGGAFGWMNLATILSGGLLISLFAVI